MSIRIRLVIVAAATVIVVIAAGAWRGVVFRTAARRAGRVPFTIIVSIAATTRRRITLAVSGVTGTRGGRVRPTGSARLIVVRLRSIVVTATIARRSGPATIAIIAAIFLTLSHAGYAFTLEFAAIKLFDSGPQVGGGFELSDSSAIALTSSFGVDDVKA
jgi:hypothetical protein